MSLSFSLFVISLSVSPCVFVRRCLSVSPFGMAVFTLFGWYEVLWMYNCLLVGLTCVLTSRRPLSLKFGPLYTVTSKNLSSFLSYLCVNLIVGWTLLMFMMNVFSCSSVPVHTRNMSSMYLFHSSMYGCPSHARIGSNDPMNSLA